MPYRVDQADPCVSGWAGRDPCVAGGIIVAIEFSGSSGLPIVTAIPGVIPPAGVALWQADQHGTPTGLGAYLHPPKHAAQAMSKTQAEVRARQINNTPGLRVAGATLASVTLPGTALRVSDWRTLDGWIVTLDFPRPVPLRVSRPMPLRVECLRNPCPPPFLISKNLVLVDAQTGMGQILLQTN